MCVCVYTVRDMFVFAFHKSRFLEFPHKSHKIAIASSAIICCTSKKIKFPAVLRLQDRAQFHELFPDMCTKLYMKLCPIL